MIDIKKLMKGIGCNLSTKLENIVTKLQADKEDYYGRAAAEFQYFIKGKKNNLRAYKNPIEYLEPESLYHATDTQSRSIATQSITSFSDALLPKGYESIKVILPKYKQVAETTNNMAALSVIKEIEEIYTTMLQNILKDNRSGFTDMFYRAVDTYINYGICMSYLTLEQNAKGEEYFRFHGVIFDDIYIGKTNERGKQILMYRKVYRENLEQDEVVEYVLYVPTNNILEEAVREEYKEMLKDSNISIDSYFKIELELNRKKLKVVKGNWYGNIEGNIKEIEIVTDKEVFYGKYPSEEDAYSKGAGILGVGAIRQANIFYNAKSIAGSQALNPTAILAAAAKMTGESLDITADRDKKKFKFKAGNVIRIRAEEGSNMSRDIQTIQPAYQTLEVFNKLYNDAIEQVGRAYYADLFNNESRANETATAVIQRREINIRVFNGVATGFYTNYLIPMLKFVQVYINELMRIRLNQNEEYIKIITGLEEVTKIPIFEDAQIKIDNFETQQKESLERERLQNKINIAASISQIKQAPPDEAMMKDIESQYYKL